MNLTLQEQLWSLNFIEPRNKLRCLFPIIAGALGYLKYSKCGTSPMRDSHPSPPAAAGQARYLRASQVTLNTHV